MSNFNIDYLVVAGGGGATVSGGGAGGLITNYGGTSLVLNTSTMYSITVGAGGAGGVYGTQAISGTNSIISGNGITTITSIGGGGGTSPFGAGGQTGGSGAGGSAFANSGAGGAGTSGQGFGGGTGYYTSGSGGFYGQGGGGGAFQLGGDANTGTLTSGNGGNGISTTITGSALAYSGGGGGGVHGDITGYTVGSGGTGGGGDAAPQPSSSGGAAGSNGLTNTGGGGGGCSSLVSVSGAVGGSGGSGIVILRYATADANYTATGLTPTETTDGTDTILSFTTVGTGSITFTLPPPPPFNGTTISNELLDLNQQNNEIGLRIPVGNDTNEPTPDVSNTGSIRYNTDHQALSISNGTEFQIVDSEESTLPTVTLTNSWRAWDTASFVNGGTSCTDVTGSLVLGPYSSGSPGAFFYGSFNNVAGNKYWVLNGGGSHGRRAGFTRPTEFTISYWGNKPSNPGYNSERAIWSFNIFGSDNIRLARRNNAGTSSLRIYSGNSSIATFADGITTSTWYNITLTFSSNTVKTYVGVQGSTNTTLINTTTLSSGNFPTGILNDSNGTGFWIGTNSGYTDWSTDSWSGLNIYDGVARQAEIDTIVSNGYQQ